MSGSRTRTPLLGRPAPPGRRWVVDLGVEAFPYLADHAVQGLAVLPGSAYVEMAVAAGAACGAEPSTVTDVRFERAFIVPRHGHRSLQILLSPDGTGGWHATMAGADTGIRHATAHLRHGPGGEGAALRERVSQASPRWERGAEVAGDSLYARLRAAGNEFGPSFRGVQRCRVGDGAALGLLVPGGQPAALDTAMQVLAMAAGGAADSTLVLAGCDHLRLLGPAGRDSRVYGLLRAEQRAGGELVGDALVTDEAGNPTVELVGVRLRRLSRAGPGSSDPAAPGARIAVAGTFTVEPVADVLAFWLDTLGRPATVEIAPPGQLTPQLLDPASLLCTNVRGANVIMVRPEDLASRRPPRTPLLTTSPPEVRAGEPPRFPVPGVGEIAHVARYETEFLYDEIFVRRAYLRYGIELRDGDVVFDVGANIGMFTLFVHSRCPDARVYAFEPAPQTFDVLRRNTSAYSPTTRLFDVGLAETAAERQFTFYPGSTAFSGFAADETRDRANIEAAARNLLRGTLPPGSPDLEPLLGHLMRSRLDAQRYPRRTRTLSDVVTEQRLERIDLLKVDAEGYEARILAGIDDIHWPWIRQIVVEVHGPAADQRVRALLERHGFDAVCEERDELLRGTGFRLIFARRRSAEAPARRRAADPAHPLEDSVRPVEELAHPLEDPVRPVEELAHPLEDPVRPVEELAHPLEDPVRPVEELVSAVAAARSTAPVPCLAVLCPPSAAARRDPALRSDLDRVQRRLTDGLAGVPGVLVITPDEVQRAFPVPDYDDPRAEELAGIPYTNRFFAAVGTLVARRYQALDQPPAKVLALDCDQTLWSGRCGEDGPSGVSIGPPYRALQEFAVAQHDAGVLVCLCSRNNAADVLSVFRERVDMPLRLEHLSAWRLDWQAKSGNLASLAAELGVGVDGIVFLDDDPVECAEVRANIPDVLTLRLPEDSAAIPGFLGHIWAFDRVRTTDEDQVRAARYRDERRRRGAQTASDSFADFLARLDLRVAVAPSSPADLPRVAQLTQRVNQFTTTGVRRTEAELTALLAAAARECLTVRVTDRFGDYGLVGAVLFGAGRGCLRVDALLLSCRALGRGVEHQILAALGELAVRRGVDRIEVPFAPTGRNLPARQFLEAVTGPADPDGTHLRFTITAPAASRTVFRPDGLAPRWPARSLPPPLGAGRPAPGGGADPALYRHITEDLRDLNAIVEAVGRSRIRHRPLSRRTLTAPTDDLEASLVELWRRVLGIDEVGVDDNFFDLGGTSLLAVQVVSELTGRLSGASAGWPVSAVSLFECPTVRAMAALLRGDGGAARAGESGQRRGEHRRGPRRRRPGLRDGPGPGSRGS